MIVFRDSFWGRGRDDEVYICFLKFWYYGNFINLGKYLLNIFCMYGMIVGIKEAFEMREVGCNYNYKEKI